MPIRPGSGVQEALTLARQIGPYLPVWRMRNTLSPSSRQCCRDVAATHAHADALLAVASDASLGAPRGAGTPPAGVGAGHAGRRGRRGGTPPPGVGASRRGTRAGYAPIVSPRWPRRMAGRGSPRPGSRSWPRPRRGWPRRRRAGGRPRCLGSRGSCCATSPALMSPRQKQRFLRALDVARRQQAKALELRAAHEPRAALAGPREAYSGPTAADPDLWLLHRRIGYRRFTGGQRVAGRAGLILRAGHDPLMSTPAYAARADASADARAHTGC